MMRVPLYAQIYTYLIDEIMAGRLKPGDRIPSEKALAEQFSVSRITSKKALENLERARVIERARGRGSFIAKVLPDLRHLSPTEIIPPPPRPLGLKAPAICLLLPDFTDAYGHKLVYAIESRLSEYEAFVVLKRTYGERDAEQQGIQRFVQSGGEGIIIAPVLGEFYSEELLRLVLDGYPLVMVDRLFKGVAACTVCTDNRQASYDLTTYLIGSGHEHIAFLSPPVEGTSSFEERLEGFGLALDDRGLGPRAKYQLLNLLGTSPQVSRPDEVRDDEKKIREFIAGHPQVTAFLAGDYDVALTLSQTLRSLGMAVPDEFALACFDSPDDPYGLPAFTHIRQDETSMGHLAVDLLMSKIRGEAVPTRTVVPCRLVEGRSTRPIAEQQDLATIRAGRR
jgi:GntR family transcriptional regulator of arabinose operon